MEVALVSITWRSSSGFHGLCASSAEPSGRQLYSLTSCGRLLNWRASPPCMDSRYTCIIPLRSLKNASVCPSGDQRGAKSCCAQFPCVTCRGGSAVPSPVCTSQMALLVVSGPSLHRSTVKAICVPSGESCGSLAIWMVSRSPMLTYGCAGGVATAVGACAVVAAMRMVVASSASACGIGRGVVGMSSFSIIHGSCYCNGAFLSSACKGHSLQYFHALDELCDTPHGLKPRRLLTHLRSRFPE